MSLLKAELLEQECACGSGKRYQDCCYGLHQYQREALTAEELMRSRYVAFKMHLADYLLDTWSQETRPMQIDFDESINWTKLNINGRKKGRKTDQQGWVTFIAYYEFGNLLENSKQTGSLHETSYFLKDNNGLWKYVDGEIKN